jgi:hypothetical protein
MSAEIAARCAEGATRRGSWQKPRFLPAVHEVMSAEIAARCAEGATRRGSWQKPRFLPAVHEVMSAEIAAGNFSQID